MNKQVKIGAIISYLLIILNATYGIFLTPFIVRQLGDSSYGVYKSISSITAAFMVLDSGVGATVMRYVAKYKADEEENKIPNFLFMGLVQVLLICLLIVSLTVSAYVSLDNIYGESFTPAELSEAKTLFVFLAVGMLAHIGENFINGIISGYNRFAFANGARIFRLITRIIAIVIFLGIFKNSIVLVLIDLLVTLAFIAVELLYIRTKLRVKIQFSHWDKSVFKESFIYILLMFLGTLVDQVNGNFSIILVGAQIGTSAVTVYSMAVLIFNMYMNLSTAISGVMLPTVTMTLKSDDEKYTNTQSLVAQVGRIQFLLLGAVAAGFSILGIPFIKLWLGDGYHDVYALVLILLFPAMLELCINVCLSILRAKNKIGFRTAVIAVAAAFNLLFIAITLPYLGYFSAAWGTACSFLFGSVIVMGIYYYRILKINIVKLYGRIFKGIWLCILLSSGVAYLVSYLFAGAMYKLVFGILSFCIVYAATLLLFGLNKEEKNIILTKIRRKKHG